MLVWNWSVLKARVHKLHLTRALDVLLGDRYQLAPGLDRRDVEAPSDETTRQLTGATPELKHSITAPESGDLTCMSDQRVGIGWAAAVILARNLVEHPAVAPRGKLLPHTCKLMGNPPRSSCGWFDDDCLTEAFELGDQALDLALRVDAAVEVVRAGVDVELAGREHVPGGDDD